MNARRTFSLIGIVGGAVLLGVLTGALAQPDWFVGFGPALLFLILGYLFLKVREQSTGLRQWRAHREKMWKEGREPRIFDETATIPPQSVKDYQVKLLEGFSLDLRAFAFSDGMLVAEIVDAQQISQERPTVEKRSLEAQVVLMDFKPKHPGTWVIRLRNLADAPATVSVIVHLYGPPSD